MNTLPVPSNSHRRSLFLLGAVMAMAMAMAMAMIVLSEDSSTVLFPSSTRSRYTRKLASTTDIDVADVADVAGSDNNNNNNNNNNNSNNRIGIIHLGKCHGIGMQHSLYTHKESAIVQRGYDWYHMDTVPVDKHHDWIALMRNPIDRIISTYLFEHPKNAPYRKNPMHVTLPYADKLHLYDCYDSIDDLATNGMATLLQGQLETECSALAKRLLHDYMSFPGMTHFVWNYQSYYTQLLQQSQTKTIYAVRAEHMVADMNAIEHILGNPKKTEFPALTPFSHYKMGHSGTSLPVTDKTVSPQGMRNLCELLCAEMMRYRHLANEARNLNDVDRTELHAKLQAQCPHVANLERCPQQRADFPAR